MTFKVFRKWPVISHPGQKPQPSQALFRPQTPSGLHPATGLGGDDSPAQDTPTDCRGWGCVCVPHTHTPVDVCLPAPCRRFSGDKCILLCQRHFFWGNLGVTIGHGSIRPTGPSQPLHTPPNHTLQAASVWRGPLSPSFSSSQLR